MYRTIGGLGCRRREIGSTPGRRALGGSSTMGTQCSDPLVPCQPSLASVLGLVAKWGVWFRS